MRMLSQMILLRFAALMRLKFGLLALVATTFVIIVLLFSSLNIKELMLSTLLGEATVYASCYSESGFHSIVVGMTVPDLQSIVGQPIKRAPWGEHGEVWFYTDQRSATDNFWRRVVIIDPQTHRVTMVIKDFWID